MVQMGNVQFVSFQEVKGIGTEGLGSCSVVLIASAHGAILAHIPPQPFPDSLDPFAGDINVRRMMGRVDALYQHHRSQFPSADTAVICACFKGAIALPDQVQIMSSSLQEMGLDPVISTYQVPGNWSLPSQGTVKAIRDDDQTKIYVEHRMILSS